MYSNTSPYSAQPLSTGVQVNISNLIGDRIQTAFNLGDINSSSYSYCDLLSGVDTNDFYQFRLTNAGSVNLTLKELEADADLYLLDRSGNIITTSIQLGTNDESIVRDLEAGTYYIQIATTEYIDNIYVLGVEAGGTTRDPGQTLATAQDLGNISYKTYNVTGSIAQSDPSDYYRFELIETGNVDFHFSNFSPDLNLSLYGANGNLICNANTINQQLAPGSYYVRAYAEASADYNLIFSSATAPYTGTRTLTGTFGADNFDLIGTYRRTVISGNGNIDFGEGARDRLDLSNLASTNVTINFATSPGGGSFYNPGNGMRLFDSITLNDGRYILFEGIDEVQFSDRTINLAVTPNDPLFNQQWNLGMMGVHNAWRFTTGSNDVLIGIQDTGLALTPEGRTPFDLRSTTYNLDNNLADDFRDRSGPDYLSHGTAVQSIIAANTNNGSGMSGINWGSEVYAVDVLGGNVGDFSLSRATTTMAEFAASKGKRLVINMSLGYDGFNQNGLNPEFEAAVIANPNVLFVISAGNDGDQGRIGLGYPANLSQRFNNVMAVGASWGKQDYYGRTRTPGTRIEYAGWWGSQYGPGLTIMAPSEVIAREATRYTTTTYYDYMDDFNGTSAAAPNITGVASLVWSANPNLSAAQVNQILCQTATDLGRPGYDIYYGNGFVNADVAVRRAIAIGSGYA
ncbi:MAG: S8 family serine peptidase [Alkalinema sp. RU_4_3]|nr:S8 family serine peptidase [Alkalinema sp. RU_4_3]